MPSRSSSDSSHCSSQVASQVMSTTDVLSSHHPLPSHPLPLQLGRLTNKLHNLHSSSTHSLNTASISRDHQHKHNFNTLDSGNTTPLTKSLQNLDKLTSEDTSLDGFTKPSIITTCRGRGTFRELFLPPPIMPLPKIERKRKKAVTRSPSRTQSPSSGRHTQRRGSRTPSPSVTDDLQLSNTKADSHSGSRHRLMSSSQSVEKPVVSIVEGGSEMEGQGGCSDVALGAHAHSKAAQQLLQKRAKFCKPGNGLRYLSHTLSEMT